MELENQKKDHYSVVSQFKEEIKRLHSEIADKKQRCDLLYDENQQFKLLNQNLNKIILSLQGSQGMLSNVESKNEFNQEQLSYLQNSPRYFDTFEQFNPSLISNCTLNSQTCPSPQQPDVINMPNVMNFGNNASNSQVNDLSQQGKGPKLVEVTQNQMNQENQQSQRENETQFLNNNSEKSKFSETLSPIQKSDITQNKKAVQAQIQHPQKEKKRFFTQNNRQQQGITNLKEQKVFKNKNDQRVGLQQEKMKSKVKKQPKQHVKEKKDILSLSDSLSFSVDDFDEGLCEISSDLLNHSKQQNLCESQTSQEQFQFFLFRNGDFQSVSPEGISVYYYAITKTTVTKLQDGTSIIQFSTGQQEVHNADKSKLVKFPDGSVKVINPNGIENFYSPEENIQITDAQQIRILEFQNNRKDYILPDKSIIKVFPNGIAKWISVGKKVYTAYIKKR